MDQKGHKTYLGVDVGNTHTVLGLFQGPEIIASWRIATRPDITSDELAAGLMPLLGSAGYGLGDIEDLILSCVVPPLASTYKKFCQIYVGSTAMVITGASQLGMPILYERPFEVGADRLVNSIAAYELFRSPLIVIDFGTAVTFDCASNKGEYLGGAIAPGPLVSAETLFKKTAKLPLVDLFSPPESILAQDTVSAIKTGIIYGFAGLTDRVVQCLSTEFPSRPKIIATGGLAEVIAPFSETIERVVPDLTLQGLAIIYKRLKKESAPGL